MMSSRKRQHTREGSKAGHKSMDGCQGSTAAQCNATAAARIRGTLSWDRHEHKGMQEGVAWIVSQKEKERG